MQNKKQPLTIWFISDNKPGHTSQMQGLEYSLFQKADAFGFELETFWLPCGLRAHKSLPANSRPDWVIGAGHATHKSLLYYARKYAAFSTCLMKPSLPLRWFGCVICPEHDDVADHQHVLRTVGTINKIIPRSSKEMGSDARVNRVMLLGGPSKHFDWSDDAIIEQVLEISQCDSKASSDRECAWQIFNSRRTPDSTWDKLSDLSRGRLALFDYRDEATPALQDILSDAQQVWVSCDSISMIYEALTSGAKVGLLDLPLSRKESRLAKSISHLKTSKRVMSFSAWQDGDTHFDVNHLWEADRAADWVLSRYQEWAGV